MVEIKKIKIEKKLYRFEVKKRYQYLGRYRVKKRSQLDKIRAGVLDALKPKSAKNTKLTDAKAVQASQGINPLMLGGAIMLIALLVIAGWFYITIQLNAFGSGIVKPPAKADLAAAIIKTGVVTAGQRNAERNVGYVRADYVASGIVNYSVNLTVYAEDLPTEVFLLKSGRQQAIGYEEFARTLAQELGKKKIEVNEITFSQVEALPGGAIIIVPTGFIPQEMLGIGSTVDLYSFMEKGNVMIYMGLPFDRMLNGSTVVPTPQEKINELDLHFDETLQMASKDGLRLFDPRYQVLSRFNSSIIYGLATVIKKESGAIIFLPQTLDAGWVDDERKSSPKAAGEDIARVVLETKWATNNGDSKVYHLDIPAMENVTENHLRMDFFTDFFKGNRKSAKIEFFASTKDGRNVQMVRFAKLGKESNGGLYAEEAVIAPKVITGENTRFNARLSEQKAEQKKLFFSIKRNGEEVGEKIEIGTENVEAADITTPIPIDLDTGEYIASIVDDDGKVYAEGYIKVVFLDVKFAGQPDKGKYEFTLEKDGQPTRIRNIEVSVENGKYGVYSFNDTSDLTVDLLGATGGEDLALGKTYRFQFKFGKIKKDLDVPKPKPPPPLPPEMIFIAVFAIGIMAIGLFFARKPQEIYALDIPDFPPVAKTKIALSKDIVLSLFEKINEDYRWKATPLTVGEVKNGFKRVFYQGKPVFITDYNVEYLLNELIHRGLVIESLDYYCLEKWETETKRSARHLATFRKLRDVFVNNALPFTALGESEDCDTKITVVGQDMYVHITDKSSDLPGTIKRVLGSLKKGINIMLFMDNGEKRDFYDMLASPTKAMLTLKLEVEGDSVQLLTIEEFEKMLMDFKSV